MKTPVLVLDAEAIPESAADRVWGMFRDEGYLHIEGDLIAALPFVEICEAARKFFAQPLEHKMRYYIGDSPIHRGYLPIGEEGDPNCGPDIKEGFDTGLENLGRPILQQKNPVIQMPWPDIGSFEQAVLNYRAAVEKVAHTFAVILSEALGCADCLVSRAKRPPNQLRLLNYPPSPVKQTQGVGTHTDYECFTIMQVSGTGFLVQRPSGDWIEVAHRPESAIITLGDIVEVLTNGALRATPHRVGWVRQERLSFPYFYSLDATEFAAPLPIFVTNGEKHYVDTSVGHHIYERTTSTFKYLRSQTK